MIGRDITERKRAEEALRESCRRIENILESATDAFYALDREWRFTYINERALHRIQRARGKELTREELLGKSFWEVFPEGVGSVFYQKYHEAMREQKTVEFEARSLLRDEWVDVHAYPSEEGLALYYQDITERKKAEERVEDGREAERSRLARDLHDEPLQELTDAVVEAQYAQSITKEPEPTRRLGRLVAALKRTEQRVRAAVYDLGLGGDRDRAFTELLENLIEIHREMAPEIEISLEAEGADLTEPLGRTGTELLVSSGRR